MDFNQAIGFNTPVKASYFDDLPMRFNMAKIKAHMMPTPPFKQNMLRRRMDEDSTVIDTAIFHIVAIFPMRFKLTKKMFK